MDSREVFSSYLNRDSSLNQEEIELICGYFQEEFLKKEEPLLIAGKKFKNIVFVVEGILRVFIIDKNGDEVVKNFIEPNNFFADIESLEKDQKSMINVSAVTDCVLLSLSKNAADKLVGELPKWEYLMKVGAVRAMNDMIRKLEFLHIGNSAEQYNHFVENFPMLAQQVPLKYIASFLKITQSSLSRIRRQSK